MMNQEQESDREKWVYDLSFDHKGRVPLRASTGAWRASFFVIATGFCESLCYFGLAANLIVYMTTELNQDVATAVRNVNYWTGVSTLMPLVGGFVADSYLGRFRTVVAASVVYLMGLVLLTMSRVIPGLKPCDSEPCDKPRKIHEIFFFFTIYMLSIGMGGHKPSVESFGADQFDDDHLKERLKKMSFFNLYVFILCFGLLVGVTGIVYIQDHVGWAALDIVLTSVMAFALVIFCLGRPFYRFRKPTGSPFTPMLQVLVAAILKRNVAYPSAPQDLYEVQGQRRLLFHTNKLRFLDKAAVIIEEPQISTIFKHNPWRLATVTRVEELKLVINIIPIWLTILPFGICFAQSNTFFIKQSMILNRKISPHFTIPPATMFGFNSVGVIFSIAIYDRLIVPFLRRVTGNERGINILTRIGIGLIFSAVAMIVAALVEKKRLDNVDKNSGSEPMMSVFWIAPQYLIMAIGETYTIVGLQEYFYEQVPDSMRSLGIALYLSVIGTGSFVSSFLVTLVERVTRAKSGKSWFDNDLNHSRLDYFYYLLAGISALDACVYVFVAMNISYKNVRNMTVAAVEEDCHEEGDDRMEV